MPLRKIRLLQITEKSPIPLQGHTISRHEDFVHAGTYFLFELLLYLTLIFNVTRAHMSQKIFYESLLRPVKTRSSIADEYNVDVRTLKRWLLIHGIEIPKGAIPPRYQSIIYEALGPPPCTDKS